MGSLIDTLHHFEINGVKYRAAESAEGDHYDLSGEPLRPPNAVMVQGEGRQDKFQARPDMLLWNITDWSGGEGQIVFDPQAHNRHAILQNVDPFVRPGTLAPGYFVEDCTDDAPATLSESKPLLVRYGGLSSGPNLALFSSVAGEWWLWDHANGTFDIQAGYTGTANGFSAAVAEDNKFYLGEDGLTKIWTLTDAGGAASALVTATITAFDIYQDLALVGDYLYQIDWAGFEVFEIVKSTGAVTSIDTAESAKGIYGTNKQRLVAAGPNRLYVALPLLSGDSVIREIIPTSAAGPGFGTEIARFPSTWINSLWYHQGTLFIGTVEHVSDLNERALLYHTPGGTYGALGRPRIPIEEDVDGVIQGSSEGNRLDETAFVLAARKGSSETTRIYALDTVSGGYAQIAGVTDPNGAEAGSPFRLRKSLFFTRDADAATGGVWRVHDAKYASAGHAITPWHDMGLSDEKILSSVILSCEALPADWTVTISYAVNGSSSFTSAGAYSTATGTGTRYQVSTDSTTKKFRTLRIKVEFTYTGGGTPTTRPVVHGVEVRAQVAKPVPVWNLLLDLSDDESGGSQSLSGDAKFTNLKTASDAEKVVDFKDGYPYSDHKTYVAYDVIVDAYHMVLDRPGEGIAAVSLRQVV